MITCPPCPIVIAECKIVVGRIGDMFCETDCALATICCLATFPIPETVVPRIGELNTAGAELLIWELFDEFDAIQVVPCAGLGVLGGLTNAVGCKM